MRIIVLLLIIHSNLCLSEDPQFERVKTKCTENIDWSKQYCNFVKEEEGYAEGGSYLAYAINHSLTDFSEMLQKTTEYIRPPGVPYLLSEGSIKKTMITNLISEYLEKKPLSNCQKACLIKCVSSAVLKYKLNLYTKVGPLNAVYDDEEGLCTEYSRVFDELSSQFNLPSRVVSSITKLHSYNKVKLQGQWVYLEPQSSKCQFFVEDPKQFKGAPAYIDYSLRKDNLKKDLGVMPADKTRVYVPKVISQ